MECPSNTTNAINFPPSTVVRNASLREHGIDISRYEKHVRNLPLSPLEKEGLLEALWKIIATFVELGFGEHPTQNLGDLSNLDAQIIRAVENHSQKAA